MRPKQTEQFNPQVFADTNNGVAAVLIGKIASWIISNANRKDKRYYKDGRYWTCGSVSFWEAECWWATYKQVRTALDRLEDTGYLISANYNKDRSDRTLWYALTPKAEDMYVLKDSSKPPRKTRRSQADADALTPEVRDFIEHWNSHADLTHIDARGLRMGAVSDITDLIATYGEDLPGIIDTYANASLGWYAKNDKTNTVAWLCKVKDGKRNISKFADMWITVKDRKAAAAVEVRQPADYRAWVVERGVYDPETHEMDWAYFDAIKGSLDTETQQAIERDYGRADAE